ncbi:MAG TPA: acetyl-CoA carboxylase carboxyl transferase subunit alpha, partial [Paracoccus sp.]|nr:acetyl-CoA carboxylase carboxyl transferase subunit alpha [Paracoccus sp. (in: a-proteobacteria)]
LKKLGVIDRIIPEPVGGAQRMPATAIAAVGKDIAAMLKDLAGRKPADLIRDRRQKFLSMGASSLA